MKISRDGIELVKEFEGCLLVSYPDPATGGDPWTVGYGITTAAGVGVVKKGMKITQQQADDMLVAALVKYEMAVQNLLKRSPSQHQFDAMVALCFNIGPGAFAGSSVLKYFNAGDLERAADSFRLWRKANGKVMNGLVRRREAERQLFLRPVSETSPEVTRPADVSQKPGNANTSKSLAALVLGLVVAALAALAAWIGGR